MAPIEPQGQATAPGGAERAWHSGPAVTALIFIGLAAVPCVSESYSTYQMTQLLIYAIAILGLNMLTGINGQFSLGHGAFLALGAYTAAILIEQAGVHYLLTLPAAGALCFVAGFLFGLPALRLEGAYLALATFALAVATPQIIKLSLLAELTGGVQGIAVFSATFEIPVPTGLALSPDGWTYYLTLATGALIYVLASNIVNSRTGRALIAIRENPVAALAMGINLNLYKATAFGISSLITGVAGALGAISVKYVAPDSFTLGESIKLFVGMVIGGVGWLPGALVGAAAILFLPNLAEQVSTGLAYAINGFMLILIIYIAPEGAAGVARAAGRRAGRLLRDRSNRESRR